MVHETTTRTFVPRAMAEMAANYVPPPTTRTANWTQQWFAACVAAGRELSFAFARDADKFVISTGASAGASAGAGAGAGLAMGAGAGAGGGIGEALARFSTTEHAQAVSVRVVPPATQEGRLSIAAALSGTCTQESVDFVPLQTLSSATCAFPQGRSDVDKLWQSHIRLAHHRFWEAVRRSHGDNSSERKQQPCALVPTQLLSGVLVEPSTENLRVCVSRNSGNPCPGSRASHVLDGHVDIPLRVSVEVVGGGSRVCFFLRAFIVRTGATSNAGT